MAAEKPRPEKVAAVTEVRDRLSSASATLLTEYRGLKVHELANLRNAVREAGGDYKIYKNTLVRLAAQDLELTELEELLTGPTAIAFVTGDAVLVAKSLRDFARTNPNLTIKGGLLGRSVLSAGDAAALADVAPREVLLAQFAGALAAPLQKFAGLLAALPRNFAYGLKALLDQKGGPPPEADEAPAAEPEAAAPQAAAEAPAAEAPAPEPAAEAPAAEPEAAAPGPAAEAPAAEAPATAAEPAAAEHEAADAPEVASEAPAGPDAEPASEPEAPAAAAADEAPAAEASAATTESTESATETAAPAAGDENENKE